MNEKIRGIDGLKGITAVIIAYVYHYCILFETNPFHSYKVLELVFDSLNLYIGYAEGIFFLISGFMMSYIYEEKIKELSLLDFLKTRVKKIYPMMIVSVVIVFLLENLGKNILGYYPLYGERGDVQYSLSALLSSILGIQTGYFSDGDTYSVNGPTWFISILFLCYLISFSIMKIGKDKKIRMLCIMGMFFIGVIISFSHGFDFPLLYSCNGRGYTEFFLGILMAKFINREKKIPTFSGVFLLILAFVLCAFTKTYLSEERIILTELFLYPVVFYLVLKTNWMASFLHIKILRYLGRISMPIYIFNFPVLVGIVLMNDYFQMYLDYSKPLVWVFIVEVSILIAMGIGGIQKKIKEKRYVH